MDVANCLKVIFEHLTAQYSIFHSPHISHITCYTCAHVLGYRPPKPYHTIPYHVNQGHAGTEFCGWWGVQVLIARSAGRNNTSYIGQLGKARAIFLNSTRWTTCAPCQLALVTRIITTFSISPRNSRSGSVALPGPSGTLAVKICQILAQTQLSKGYR